MTASIFTHPIPYEAFLSHMAVIGKTGSGKSYAIRSAIEALLDRHERVCIVDPTGAWWGLKSGYPVVIFGGEHADLPIGQSHGEAISEVIGTSSTPAIIDTSLMRTRERTRFFADFADGLIRKNKGPLHLVIDEAHVFAPQGKVPDPASGEMLHAANNLVSLGRSRGLRIVLITQRPAKLHKDSLTQVETLVAMRLIAPQDRKAVEEWIKDNADPATGREIITSLAALKTGYGYVWAPELQILKKVAFPKIRTYDSSSAPTGKESNAPRLREIDLSEITARLETVSSEALSNDPARLKRRIAELEKQLQIKESGPSESEINARIGKVVHPFMVKLKRISDIINSDLVALPTQQISAVLTAEYKSEQRDKNVRAREAMDGLPDTTGLRKGALRILSEMCARYPAGYSRPQVGTLTKFTHNGGTFKTYFSDLRTRGFIEERGGLVFATDSAMKFMGDGVPAKPTSHAEAMSQWRKSLRAGAYKMLESIVGAKNSGIDRAALAVSVSMEESGGTFKTYLSDLRRNGLINYVGNKVYANDILFP